MGGCPPRAACDTLSGVSLSDESVTLPVSSVSDGIEFEETFPEAQTEPVAEPTPAPQPAPRLSVVRPEPAAEPTASQFQEQLERRMAEAEALVKQTIERLRRDEDKRLTEWIQSRREEEGRRLARWADEQRATTPRLERRAIRDDVVTRLEEALREWQERFEERQRISDEERRRAWRTDLERALARQLPVGEHVVAPARADRSPLASAVAAATSARDLARIVHGAGAETTKTSAFALALHQEGSEDVVYRYRLAVDDEVGTFLRAEVLDDSAASPVAHADSWLRAQRVARVGTRNVTVHTAQLAIRAADRTIGVLTLQTEATPIADTALPRIAELVRLVAPRLAELRDAGNFRGA